MKEELDKILKFQKERDWKQFHLPKNLAISLAIESAEILEIFQWTKDNDIPKDKKEKLAEELADVYYYLLLLCHETGINLKKAFEEKMELNEKKYPTEVVKGKAHKYTYYKDKK